MKIILLAGNGVSSKFIFNGLKNKVAIEKVLMTSSVSKSKMVKRRIKRLGFLKVANQLIFQIVVTRLLKQSSRNKYYKRVEELGLDKTNIPSDTIVHVGSVNSDECINQLKEINPDIVIVNGTSIISDKVLNSTDAIFINTHIGITPQYRGVHGGYWALRNRDKKNFGVTVHKVDTGIDTGDILYQATTEVSGSDNFITYPLYQYSLAIPLLIKCIEDISLERLNPYKKENVSSNLYYHPTLTEYIYGWLKYGVK